MIYLLLAIISSALVSIFMRLGTHGRPQSISMLASNYLICTVIAVSIMGPKNIIPQGGLGSTLPLGLFTGLLYLLGFLLLQLNVQKNGVVLSSVFIKLGLLVPMVLSIAAFGEIPRPVQIIGFIIALGAMILINLEKNHSAMEFRLGLILLLLVGGCSDAMSKVFEQIGNPMHSEQFLFLTFFAALILCVFLALLRKERPTATELLYGLLIGIPNYFSARFLLMSLETLPAVITYPTFSVATIVVVAVAGVVFFKEKLGKRQWTAVGAILVALALLNL